MPHQKNKTTFYTLVQHSAFALNGDESFQNAVESRVLCTKSEAARVLKAGGVLESDWRKINEREVSENYPTGRNSKRVLPQATGTFASARIDGQRVYVPATRNSENATS